MSTPKKKAGDGKPKKESKPDDGKLHVFFRLDGPEREALERFMKSQLIEPSPPQVAVGALLDFLSRHGFYPPRQKGE